VCILECCTCARTLISCLRIYGLQYDDAGSKGEAGLCACVHPGMLHVCTYAYILFVCYCLQYDDAGSKGEDREEAGLDAGGGGAPGPKIGTVRPGGEEKEETFYDAGAFCAVWRFVCRCERVCVSVCMCVSALRNDDGIGASTLCFLCVCCVAARMCWCGIRYVLMCHHQCCAPDA
jgi:hypothetical protein